MGHTTDERRHFVSEPTAEVPVDRTPWAVGHTAPDVMDPGSGDATGDPRVDAAVVRLAGLGSLPTHEHVEVFEDVHRRLQGALADLDGG